MNRSAPRSIDQYLRQLREELAGADAALIQDALYDAGFSSSACLSFSCSWRFAALSLWPKAA